MKTQYFQMWIKKQKPVEGGLRIQGFASTPNQDRHGDIVEAKAFESSLSLFMENPVLLLQHDPNKTIGFVDMARISEKGVFVEAIVSDKEAIEKIEGNQLRAFSVGFTVKDMAVRLQGGEDVTVDTAMSLPDEELNGAIRVITDLEWVELSVVAIPSNRQSLFTIKDSLKKALDTNYLLKNNLMEKELLEVKEEVVEPVVEEEVVTEETATEEVVEEVKEGDVVEPSNPEPAENVDEASTDVVEEVETAPVVEGEESTEVAGAEPEEKSFEIDMVEKAKLDAVVAYAKGLEAKLAELNSKPQYKGLAMVGMNGESETIAKQDVVETKEDQKPQAFQKALGSMLTEAKTKGESIRYV